MTVAAQTRNADLSDLVTILREQQARKHDIVVPASKLRSDGGLLIVEGAEPEITEDGVTVVDGVYRPTAVADEGIAEKLDIPVGYLKRMRAQRPDLYDANVNGWLHGDGASVGLDPRNFLLRAFRGDDGEVGVARAVLSDSYRRMDHLDVLMATLDGVKRAGVAIDIDSCDLTERRMRVRIVAPEVAALAPVLLDSYRSPFDHGMRRAGAVGGVAGGGWSVPRALAAAAREGQGYEPGSEPVVFAGLEFGNSETGGGAFYLVPRLIVRVCRNGLTLPIDAVRSIHVGGKLDEGIVAWSAETERKNLELVTSKTADAVATFLNIDYMTRVISRVEAQAGTAIGDPAATVEQVTRALRFTEAEQASILDHFIRGGQLTAGGVLNAVTSYAQTVDDADRAGEIESLGMRALEIAASR